MSKYAFIRVLAMPVIFIVIVIALVIIPTNTRFVSAEDILSIETPSGTISDDAGKTAFVDWLTGIIPVDELCFVKESADYTADNGELYATVYQTPDKMEGIDSGEEFTYSIYRMYIRFTGGKIYYNGVEYDAADKDISDYRGFLKKYGGS